MSPSPAHTHRPELSHVTALAAKKAGKCSLSLDTVQIELQCSGDPQS